MQSLKEQIKKRVRSFLDVFMLPISWLAGKWLWWLRNQRIENFPNTRNLFVRLGVFPIIDHYYDPLFQKKYLHKSSSEPRSLYIDWNAEFQLQWLDELDYKHEVTDIPKTANEGFYYNNASFGSGDAEYWYSMIRRCKPKRVIEVGCGYSTHLTQLAIQKNKKENPDFHCEHICIEPFERPWLENLGQKVYRERLELLDLSLFDTLESGDILFIDSSHVIRPQGDVITYFLHILPRLKSGVIVHFHDIFTPFDYPESWILEEVRLFGEQYMLEVFLSNNSEWEIIGALNYLKHFYFYELKKVCPIMDENREPGSFYIRKK
ncbi:MAG: class I SAM-dependent methyltransferase [Chitinophagales bacterium]|nr:class I SAM-dependent methyltransferase [Chitinophagales bacterium]